MKKHLNRIFLTAICALGLSSCASYRAAPLNTLASDAFFSSAIQEEGIIATAKIYNSMDCQTYLDRDVLSMGYQPVQLYIGNASDKRYLFSLDRITLPHALGEEVARQAHTSTIGRVLGYGIPGLLLAWPLIIPAIIDGMDSAEANSALDDDFSFKVAKNQVIESRSHLNKLLFVPKSCFTDSFQITLIELDSNTPTTLTIKAI